MGNRLNVELFKKIRERIATIPESYDQTTWIADNELAPCGTAACLAGEAIICAAPTVADGIAEPQRLDESNDQLAVPLRAAFLLGLTGDYSKRSYEEMGETNIFWGDGRCWPEPFRSVLQNGNQAAAAVAYLDHIIETGKILE
jgi:hypothetical protein